MVSGRLWQSFSGILAIFTVATLLVGSAIAASTVKVVYSFKGDQDGEYTDTDLATDRSGNIYGTSVQGGDFASGTVFQLTPDGSGGWNHTVLYSFDGNLHGGEPYKGVTLDNDGNLVGTAVTGGSGPCEGGCGVAYKLTNNSGVWTQKVIHNFQGNTDGAGPGSRLAVDRAGNLYGVTPVGGAGGLGTIFQLQPQSNGSYRIKVLHAFTGGADGSSGSAGQLLLDARGNVYGVATTGGVNGKGTVYELRHNEQGRWTFKVLYAFKGMPDAGFPYGALNVDKAGNLYGTSYYDGANNEGSVYQLVHMASGQWKERVLYSFKGGSDGNGSIANVVFDKAGNLYGTTSEGGAGCGCGTIFKLAPNGSGGWQESVAYRFQGSPDGGFAYNGMTADPSGNLFGATVHGGDDNEGAVYSFVP